MKIPAPSAGSAQVVLRTPSRHFVLDTANFQLPGLPGLAHEAMRWSYALRSRRRWSDSGGDEASQARNATEFLKRFGATTGMLAELAQAGTIEIEIPWLGREDAHWELRILPWEFLIAGATRAFRAGKVLTVMRHLCLNKDPPPAFPKAPRVLFVVSEPGPLRGIYKFGTEQEFVQTCLGVSKGNWHRLDSPSKDDLRKAVNDIKPDVIHLAGFDSHQARALLGEPDDTQAHGEMIDGYILDDCFHPVPPQELGKILTADGKHRPQLVALNIYDSAARIAPLIVAEGAYAATGFQDTFDDDLSEMFFSVLYSRLREKLDLPHAFQAAWEMVRGQPASSQGTGVALWSASRLVGLPHAQRQTKLAAQLAAAEQKPIYPENVEAKDVKNHITASIEAYEDLNYSMLHNQRPLFRNFVLRCQTPRTIRGVRIKVSLFSGSELAVFERTLDVSPPFVELRRDIHVPLTSLLTRSVHESVRTSLLVEVSWGDHLLYQDTSRVRLIPVDQWRDTEDDRRWLPSFIFPRDRAVQHLVDMAQRYMRVLRDDPNAGFDGYQSVNIRRPETLQQIDLQVQAIWSAIVYDLRLGYINPPPGYSHDLDSQRLRTPSMIVRDHAGTCIDLALFFAACLELVDIYPAIILLKDHAFPAYWRAERYHNEFKGARPQNIESVAHAGASFAASTRVQQDAWYLDGSTTYREIVSLVNANKLVPIETVRLTENCGFWEAVAAGSDNLRDEDDFDSMIDIALAREKQITPLPILGDDA